MTPEKQKAFDSIFEEKLIQAILIDNQFGEQIMEVMDSSYFNQVYTEAIASILKDYYFKYETFPSADLLPGILEKESTSPIVLKKCVKYLEKIQKNPLNGDMDYVKEKALEFFRKQHIAKTLADQVLPLLNAGENSKLDEILPIIQSALNRGTDNDVGYEYHIDQEERFNIETEKTIPTMWDAINKMLKGGGFGQGRVVTFIASPGAGKSSCLVNCAKAALLQEKTVVYYTFELSWREVAEKFDASLTDTEIDSIIGNKQQVLLKLKEALPENARLIIKEYPVRSASVQTLRAHLSKLKLKGIIPDMIVIDQGGNLKSIAKNKEERFNLADNWLDMKNLAQTMRVPVMTAHQVNRTGYNDDVISPDQIAGCFDILGTTDIMITMARNISQKQLGLGKMLFAKNRQGEDGVILAYAINTAKCLIEVFELTDAIQGIFDQQADDDVKDEEMSLKGKLNKFLKRNKKEENN